MKASLLLLFLLCLSSLFFKNIENKSNAILDTTCLPENENNKRVVDKALKDPSWADIWEKYRLTDVTPQNIEYVSSSDPKCATMLENYNQWIVEKHPNTDLSVYTVTFQKYGSYYFVLLYLNQHPNMAIFGTSPFYILDQNLDLIEGIGL